MTKKEIQDLLTLNKVDYLQMQFIDIFGITKNVEIPQSQFVKALDGEVMFDGSSIDGFTRIEESDMLLKPDYATFRIFPWLENGRKIGRIICDVYSPDETPFPGCPRVILQRQLAEARQLGYELMVGPEMEFFLFNKGPNGDVTLQTNDAGGYFDMAPVDKGESARRDMMTILQQLDFEIEASHHEVASGQHEMDFRYENALRAADDLTTLKFVVKRVANEHNLHATFMPKPIFGISGSGMHCHQSLFQGDVNVFYDPAKDMQLSDLCINYIGGILKHCKAMVAITNPIVNSYKRLVPGYEAPINIAWSERNRSPLIRIPARRGNGTRIEVRVPDPACNPYLALTVMLAAGLDGIKNKIAPPPPVNENIYELSARQKARLKIEAIPANLSQALHFLKRDKVLTDALGPHCSNHFIVSKQEEWKEYISMVHTWEVDKYINRY